MCTNTGDVNLFTDSRLESLRQCLAMQSENSKNAQDVARKWRYAMNEKNLMNKIRLSLRNRFDVTLFRNNVGVAYQGEAENTIFFPVRKLILTGFRVIKFGLHKGSGDLIGWKEVTITESMVGSKIAQFVSLEIKRPHGRRSDDQIKWADNVNKAGGVAVFADNENEIVV
jgi:ribosomal protein S19